MKTEESKFKIEHGIAMSPRSKYPLKQMSVGDSFFVSTSSGGRRVAAAIGSCARNLGMRVALRNQGDGWRIWRIT
jgi:hypothetical protein